MKKRVNLVIKGFSLFLILQFIFACDSFKEDSIQPENLVKFTQTEFYTLPGSSIIIDLGGIIERSFVNASISVSKAPTRGTLSVMNESLYKYKPFEDFQGGEDHFDVSVVHDGKIFAAKTLTIHMKDSKEEFPCELVVVEDKITVSPGSSASIPVLNNDWLCDLDITSVNVSIYSEPRFGSGVVDGESITYVADADYSGYDELVYELTGLNGTTKYGIITVSTWSMSWTTKSMLLPDYSVTKMVFVNETTGYLAGNRIYKTTDGGEHWLQLPLNINDATINDIHFLDENNGFAVYSSCGENEAIWNCTNGLAVTQDAGASWTLTPIDYSPDISSVFFSSPTTGFMSALNWETFQSLILKTEDGGKSWTQQDIGSFDGLIYRYPMVKYANSQKGYAYQYEAVLVTDNGGDSWQSYNFYDAVVYDDILCMKVIDDNTFLAGLSTIGSFTHPTSIVKSVSGSWPKEVAVMPYKIWQLEFSPSGNTGFAVGIREIDSSPDNRRVKIALHKSTDKGESWNEESIDIAEVPYQLDLDIPLAMSVPSENIVYILYRGRLFRYLH